MVGLSEYTEFYDTLVIINGDFWIQIKVTMYGDGVIGCCLLHSLFIPFEVLALFYLNVIKA